MTSLFLDEVRGIAKQFFDLPKEEKQKYSREPNDLEGYGSDVIFTKDQRLDWTDRLYFQVDPEDQRKFKIWPQNPQNFRYSYRLLLESPRNCPFKKIQKWDPFFTDNIFDLT